ncbi:hypothetical protein RB195_025203 [Necator americanus]|uniref:Integrase catalytic domain-containing protein n=1 Tax=Necator americanus TaxID=51031 RepID=A0ABR1ER92_NECAM
MATRLVHLDVVSDLSTTAFLMMLRRFFARRGLPVSITSNNAPKFTLGETILSECLHAVQNDPAVERTVTSREIQWKHITPFAPWQRGFYERLIKSVKHSLYKSIVLAKLSFEQLTTLIIEIEELLNTRSLLYVESNSPLEQVLRPIDFLQNEFEVPYPLDDTAEDEGDPSYLPPGGQVLLRTKTQTIKALQTSCKFTEKCWQVWRDQYLLPLREKHQREVGKNRSSRYSRRKDDIVLINEPILPRNLWKMGRIHDLTMSSEGVIREAVIMLPSHRQICRPINLLVPLELEDEKRKNENSPVQVQEPKSASSSTSTERIHESENCPESIPSSNKQTSRYNLRPRRQVDYRGILSIIRANQSATLLTILLILAIEIGDLYSDEAYQHSSNTRPIRCINGGVGLISPPHIPYQVCAAEFCRTYGDPQNNVTLRFPPQVILHDHQVQWKFTENETTTIIETQCPAAAFCQNIDCIFCSVAILNPECWPAGTIILVTILLYFVISGCYMFLYVPITLGWPIRLMTSLICRCLRALINGITRRTRREHKNRRQQVDLIKLLAILYIPTFAMAETKGCQQVNIFSHVSTVCSRSDDDQTCKVQLSEVLKINPFKQHACFKLHHNSTSLHEIHVQ